MSLNRPFLEPAPSDRAGSINTLARTRTADSSDTSHSNGLHSHDEATNPRPTTQALFSDIQNLEIYGGNFSIDAGSGDKEFMLLCEYASQGAMHDSSARQPFPKCHPQTRLNVVEFFLHWITTPTSSRSVHWLYAPFGHGKSAVMQTLIDRLMAQNLQHLVAGAFFFARGRPQCNKIIYLLPTIAYQIAMNIPGMREHIINAIQADPKLFSRSIDVQLRYLIREPLYRCVNAAHFTHHPTIFIDGLDECASIDEQISVVDLIFAALREWNLPIRFLVASRPEAHIRDRFAQPRFTDILERIQLPDDKGEMTLCLKSKFDDIYDRRARLMKISGIRKPWPSPKQVEELVIRSCGQYIFLDTITRFVDSERCDPAAQLKTVICRLADSSLFTNMDSLYSLILEDSPNQDILKVVIDDLLYRRTHSVFSIPAIAEIWQFSMAEIQIVVDSLAAVVKVWEGRDLSFYHSSFQEFLANEARSGRFCCTRTDAYNRWNAGVQDTFKRALDADLVVNNKTTLDYFHTMLIDEDQQRRKWTTTKELLALIRNGHPASTWSSKILARWYKVVAELTRAFNIPLLALRQADHKRWLRGGFFEPFSPRLHQECLEIWKGIVERALAKIDPRVANALLDMGPYGMKVPELSKKTGVDEAACLRILEENEVLFHDFSPFNPDSLTVLSGDDFIRFDEEGCLKVLRYERRVIYKYA